MSLQTLYKEITIEYRADDRWHYEINGKDKSAATLTAARAGVDAVAKRVPVKQFQAYYFCYGAGYEIATVGTQVDERNEAFFWITIKGRRSKVSHRRLMKINPENDVKITQIDQLNMDIKRLTAQRSELEASLERVDLREE